MKAKTIWIIVGVVVLILIIANWNKIFVKKRNAGPVVPGKTPGKTPTTPGAFKQKGCVCDPPCSGKYNICTCSGDSEVGTCGSLDPANRFKQPGFTK